MYHWSKLLVILVHVILAIYTDQLDKKYVTKSTTYGQIRGYVHVRPNGDEVERYLGVPYASPPVGKLRFQLPVAPSVWKGVRDATAEPYACVQSKSDVHYIKQHNPGFHGRMTEDCLHVNVYVPVRSGRTIQEKSLPVLVHIHGGSNEAGMGTMLHSDTLASEGKMIVVTMNYRLGVLGFLSVPHMDIPGNYGLFDQTMALSWVQQNIVYFGGDPAKVTVQGHSAGGVDVGFHLLSPVSKGLFRYAILMSGSPTAYWALTPPTDPKEEMMGPNSHLITLGCYFKDDAPRTRACLENFNMTILLDLSFEHTRGFYDFSPVVDGTFVKRDPKQGLGDHVNAKSVMIGLVKDEGSLTVDVILKNERQVHRSGTYLTESQILQDLYNYIQVPSHFNHSLYREYSSPYVQPYVSYFQPLKDWTYFMYKPWYDPDNVTAAVITLSDLVGDLIFTVPAVDIADRLTAETDLDVFLYNFEHRSVKSSFPSWMGVPHGQDIFYLFGCPLDGHPLHNYTELDKKVSRALIKMWSKFVRSGWPDSQNDSYRVNKTYIRITSNSSDVVITKGNYLRAPFVGFWLELFPSLVQHGKVAFKMNNEFRLWILAALSLLLFILLIITLGCLVHKKNNVRTDNGVTSSAEDDVGKTPML